MPKNISAANLAAAAGIGSYAVDFVEIDVNPEIETEILRLSTLYRDVEFGGNTYLGSGHLLTIGAIDESLDVKQNSINVTLAGLDPSIIALISNTPFLGSAVTISRGYWDDTLGRLVDTPFTLWRGIANDYTTSYGGDTGQENSVAIMVSCKNLMISILEAENGRFTSPASFRRVDQAFTDFALNTAYSPGDTIRRRTDNTFYSVQRNIFDDNTSDIVDLLSSGAIRVIQVDDSMAFVASLTSFNPTFGAD